MYSYVAIHCDHAQQDDVNCPNGYSREISGINIDKHLSFQSNGLIDSLLTLTNVTMGTYEESISDVVSTSDDPICSNGRKSCYTPTNIIATLTILTDSGDFNHVSIRCDDKCSYANPI